METTLRKDEKIEDSMDTKINVSKKLSVYNSSKDFQRENETHQSDDDDLRIVYEDVSPRKYSINPKLKARTSKTSNVKKKSSKLPQVSVIGLSPKIKGKLKGNLNTAITADSLSNDVKENGENKQDMKVSLETVKSPLKITPEVSLKSFLQKTSNLSSEFSTNSSYRNVYENMENNPDLEILYETLKSSPKTPQALINSLSPKIMGNVTITFKSEPTENSLSRDVDGNVENDQNMEILYEGRKSPSKITPQAPMKVKDITPQVPMNLEVITPQVPMNLEVITPQVPMKVEDNLTDIFNAASSVKTLSSNDEGNAENNEEDMEILYESLKSSETTSQVPVNSLSLKIKGKTDFPSNNLSRNVLKDVENDDVVEIKSPTKSSVKSSLKTVDNVNNDPQKACSPILKTINSKKPKISLTVKRKAIIKVNKWIISELSKQEDCQNIHELTSGTEDEANCGMKPKKKFPCLFCTRKFVYFTYFRNHMLKAHPETNDILNS